MKTQLSSLDVSFLARELKRLEGARIDKAYQIGERDLKISLRAGGKEELIITPGYACLTKFSHDAPKNPGPFAMLLRKLISGGLVSEISQHRFDRIIEIAIEGRGRLIIELFSRGNLIFADGENTIKAVLEGQEWKDRTLRVGLPYMYPPETPDVKTMSEAEFNVAVADNKEIVKIIAANLGLGAAYANEVLARLEIDPDSRGDMESWRRVRKQISELISSDIDARIVFDGEEIDAVPFEMISYKGLEQAKRGSFNEAVDEYFTTIRSEGEKKESTQAYSEEAARLERMIAKQTKAISEMEAAAERFKEAGDAAYANFQEIDRVLKGIAEAKKNGHNWVKFSEENGLRIMDPAARKIEVCGIGIFIDKSVTENAGLYYDKAKKAKAKLDGAKEALGDAERGLERIGQKKAKVEKRLPEGPVEKHIPEWYEKFRWFISSEGFLVIGGKDATTNEMLLKKHMEPNDLAFHSTVHGAPFFIIKNPEKDEIPESTKREAAEAAASYSSAWGEGMGSADVYAFKPEQASKTPNSGEYLSKGAFVIRGEREWFRGTALKIAVGFDVGSYALAVGGPESAVASRAKHYAKIGPGNVKSGQLAKDIKLNILRQSNKEDGQKIKKVDLGEIQKWIPAGKGMLVK